MTNPPQPPDRAQVLAALIYPQTVRSAYDYPDVPEQLEASLRRQREAGMPFEVAWLRATSHVAWPWHRPERDEWQALVRDEDYIALWRSAYLREQHPALDCTEVLRRSLEVEGLDARRRRTDFASQPLRAVG